MASEGFPVLLGPDHVAAQLGVSRETAERLMTSGLIPSRNIGSPGKRKRLRTTQQAIENWKASADVDDRSSIEQEIQQETSRTYGVLRPKKKSPIASGMSSDDYYAQRPKHRH